MRPTLRVLALLLGIPGLLWLGAVMCALLLAIWQLVFRPAQSEFSAVPLILVGLPWTIWIAAAIGGSQSLLFILMTLTLGALVNPAMLLGAAAFLWRKGK